MSATIAQIITSVTDNLGDRSSGQIGSRTTEAVALDAINKAIYKIAKCKKHITALERSVTLNITTSTYQYAMPAIDSTGAAISIKKFLSWTIALVGSPIGYPIRRLAVTRRDQIFPLTNTARQGRPYYYSIFHDIIEVYPYPNTAYTMTGRAVIWPTAVTASSTSNGLGTEFDDVIEEFATAECFAKLQQIEDAKLWLMRYEDSLRKALASLDDVPDEDWFPVGYTDLVGPMGSLAPTPGHSNDYQPALGIGA